MKVENIMTREVITCSPHDSVLTVAKQMKEHGIGALPVVAKQEVQGIITDRDIIIRCIATRENPTESHVSDCMTRNPVSCTPETDEFAASEIMAQNQVRRLPVLRNRQLMGIISLGDLARQHNNAYETGEALQEIADPSPLH